MEMRNALSNANSFIYIDLPTEMRAVPTVVGTFSATVVAGYHFNTRIQTYLSGNAKNCSALTADAEL